VKGERGGILRKAQKALRAEDPFGKTLEKALETVGINYSLSGEGNTRKTMFVGMPAIWSAFVLQVAVV
jgi:hypothetical protein